MKQFIQNNKKIIGLVIILIIAGYRRLNRGANTQIVTANDLATVKKGSIQVNTQVLGTTQLTTNQKITFGVAGTVQSINVKQGDFVKKGQILAQLDIKDITNDLKSQQLNIQSARINYNKLFTNTKEYQIKQAQANADQLLGKVSLGSLDLQSLEKERDYKLSEIQSNIISTQNKIQNTKKEIEYTKLNGTDTSNKSNADYISQLQSAQNGAKSALLDSKDLYNNLKLYFYMEHNWDRPIEIGAKDKTKLYGFESSYNMLLASINELNSAIYNTDISTKQGAITLIASTQKAIDQGIKTADIGYDVLENSVDGTNLPLTTINSQKSSIVSSRSKLNTTASNIINLTKQLASVTDPATTQLGVETTISQKELALSQYNIDLSNLQASLDKTKLDYSLKIEQKKQDNNNNKSNATVSQLNAQTLINGPTNEEKAGVQNQIAQAQVNLAKTQTKFEDYQIIAQFDGVVGSTDDLKVGDEVSAMNKGITVQVPSIYEVKIMLDQLDVVKIKIGQDAIIKVDAYPNQVFTGVINNIDPTPISSNGVTSYAAKVIIQKTNYEIYNDMTATVTLKTEQKNDILIIPVLAVQSTGSTKSVQVYGDDAKLTNKIIIGGISDGENIEIMSGLQLGEKVTIKAFVIKTSKQGFNFGPPKRPSNTQNGGNNAGGPPPA